MRSSVRARFWRGILLSFAGIAGAAQSALANDAEMTQADFDALIRTEMHKKGVQGLSVATIRDGKVDWVRGFGVLDHQTKDPVTEQTTFQVASIGKVSAAYATMMLVESNLISLDETVSHPRLSIAEGCSAPTVRQALSHTTGMENDFLAATYSINCSPGSRFKYSGQGFSALGELIAARTAKPTADAVNDMVFTPLGMTLTQYGDMRGASQAQGHVSFLALFIGRAVFGSPLWVTLSGLAVMLFILIAPAIMAARSRGIIAGAFALMLTLAGFTLLFIAGTRIPAKMQFDHKAEHIAASLTSTAEDLAKFGAELMRPTLISRDSRDMMFTAQTEMPGCIHWGLGIGIDDCSGSTTYWHWGSNIGFESLLVLDPANGNGVVILTNTGGGLDTVVPGRGGYEASKIIARKVLGIDGVWDLSAQ